MEQSSTKRRKTEGNENRRQEIIEIGDSDEDDVVLLESTIKHKRDGGAKQSGLDKATASPIRLLSCEALPDEENIDCITLRDIIGHEDLAEMWQFNFMIDMDFTMDHVHPANKDTMRVNFVRQPARDEGDRTLMCKSVTIDNISVHIEPMFAIYGTHHSKIMILFFKDETVQIVIHTANMITFDWKNMTQGAWLSPRLPRKTAGSANTVSTTGTRFGQDLQRYIGAYRNKQVKTLAKTLEQYDFATVRAILIASVPGSYKPGTRDVGQWGVTRLHREVQAIKRDPKSKSHYLIAQASSIATLGGAKDTYLGPVLCQALNGGQPLATTSFDYISTPLRLIFPTVEEVAESIYGYASGGSIHFKRQTDTQKRQLDYLKPHLCKWNALKAGRQRCAPHIKTYARVSTNEKDNEQLLDYILLTSANVSKQAWGTYSVKNGQYIQSWECGVLIHPGLFPDCRRFAPVYKQDVPAKQGTKDSIYIRMPYDLPPTRYNFQHDQIWSPNEEYSTADWQGNYWPASD